MGWNRKHVTEATRPRRRFTVVQMLLMSSVVACSGVKSCFEPGGAADPIQIGDVFGSDVGKFVPCGTEGIQCLGNSKNATKVFCNCKCVSESVLGDDPFFADGIRGTVSACLPPALNPAIPCPAADGAAGATGTGGVSGSDGGADAGGAGAVAERCADVEATLESLTQAEYDVALGGFCDDDVGGFLLNGFKNTSPADDWSCSCDAGGVAEISDVCTSTCEPQICGGNCGPAWNEETGLTSIESCIGCTVWPNAPFSEPLCSASPVLSGLFATHLRSESTVELDPESSTLSATLSFEDDLGFPHDDSDTSHLSGGLKIFGRRRADGTANLGIDFFVSGSNVEFNFDGINVVGEIDAPIRSIKIAGETPYNAVLVDASGVGMIPPGALSLRVEAFFGSRHVVVRKTNVEAVGVTVDFVGKVFRVPSLNIDGGSGITSTLALEGSITNQPPTANAGGDQVLECTSPSGAEAVLDGRASTDPDQSSLLSSWVLGPVDWSDLEVLGTAARIDVLAPFSPPLTTTAYNLIVTDVPFQKDVDETLITVQDTTAPALSLDVEPDCLWAPNHKMVLFTLGDGFDITTSDVCDDSPQFGVIDVTSSQPEDGLGSGNTAPDTLFGPVSFCVRAERQGVTLNPREYTVQVRSTDASGNATTKSVTVRVGHDQMASACKKVPARRIVEDHDPRCTGN